MILKTIKDFIKYTRHHRILIQPETRQIGIAYTMIGWALIALSTVLFQKSTKEVPITLNFFMQFLGGTSVLLVAGLALGKNFLKIKDLKNNATDKKSHLPAKKRKLLLFVRGILAASGYMAYSWSRTSIGIIDNSAIFSADAIFYALIMWLALKEKIGRTQWIGILIASFGVTFIFFFDFHFNDYVQGLLGGISGVLSSIALAIIIFMNTVAVQNDPPLRIAFYQCLIGLLISLFLIALFPYDFCAINVATHIKEIIYSFLGGIFYAIALLFFFRAFLYTEPLIIAVLGYSLVIFVILFEWLIAHELISSADITSSILIAVGGCLVIYGEYRGDKIPHKKHLNFSTQPTYSLTLKEKMKTLKESFKFGNLSRFDYMSQKHEYNKLLFQFSEELKEDNIDKIEITKEGVIFTINPLKIKMETDGGCRSAPFEILNFSHYEEEEAKLISSLIKDGDIIFDIGAHIGWYAINFAKKYPQSEIYSFEPIPSTFSFLQRNIKHNDLSNVHIFNFALLDKEGNQEFHYFKGGSALSSIVNLLDHDKTEKIQCESKTLDNFCKSMKISRIDFLKCDVEGCEFQAIKGGVDSIQTFKPILFIELYDEWCEKFGYTPDDVLKFLENFGYQCFSVSYSMLKREKTIKSTIEKYNYFFLHSEKHKNLIDELTKREQ